MKLSCSYCGTGTFVPASGALGTPRELRCQQCRTEIALPQQAVDAAGPSPTREGAPTRVELFDGRYEKLGPAAETGQGFVYPAYDRTLRTFVAVKELTSSTSRACFEREIELAKVLTHENLVAIHDHGQSRDTRYLTMEFLEGAALERLLESEEISYERALDLLIMACQGMEYVHVRGVVHRALTPATLFVTSEGVLKVMGFGSAVSETDDRPTTDVLSLGQIAYRLFAGVPPDADQHQAPSARNPRVPAELDALILRALARHPEERQTDAGELCEQLMALRRRHAPQGAAVAPISSIRPGAATPGQRSPRALMLAGVAAAAVLGGGALLLRKGESSEATGPSQPVAATTSAAAAVASGPSVQQAPQADPVAPSKASSAPGPRALLGAPRCPAGAEQVSARELQLAQPRPRTWNFASHTLPALPVDGFCMDSRSVSVAAYTKCVDEGRCTPPEASCTPSADPGAAMKCVSWAAAQQYCAARGATLPSVAQWEAYAQSDSARISTSEWSADAFPPAVFAARCDEPNPARCDGHLWRKAGRLETVGHDGKGRLAFSWNRGAATSVSGYDYVSFRCAVSAPGR